MRAYVLTSFDTPPEHREVVDPTPGPGEIRVRVHATSVNPVDDLVRRGFFRAANPYRFPAVFGRDVAGVVERVGEGVTSYQVGDEVFGFVKRDYIGDGTFADYVVVPHDHFLAPRPRTIGMTESGTLGLAGITALECVEAVLAPAGDQGGAAAAGQTVLVNGASGGLGTFATQIAKASGVTVVAVVRSDAGAEYVASLGADIVLDSREGDLVALVQAAVPGGVTGLVDLVKRADPPVMGEDETEAQKEFARLCRGVLAADGRASSVTNGGVPSLMGDRAYTNVHSTPSRASLTRLAGLIDSGVVRPVVATTFEFDRIAAAFDELLAHGVRGKVAVTLQS